MTSSPRWDERGATLVEVLVSVVILSIIIAGLLGGMTTTVSSSNIGRQQADAEAILTSTGEALKDSTFYPYQCSPPYSLTGNIPALPSGWSTADVTITTMGYWNGSAFQPGCNGQNQWLRIKVTSPRGQVSWTRDIVKGPSP
jgi:Tfp pilus assembly protein PilV